MLIIADPDEMRAWSRRRTCDARRIGFVPTMGAIHAGHVALIDEARRRCDDVVVSIFVNPLQFNEPTDFDGYPRPIDDDVAACAASGVAVVYAPTAATMYPEGFQTRIVPGPLAEAMEGPMRPGHFEGVVTVVAKLFGAVRPDVAVFGEKDYQQLRIVSSMASDLDVGIEIVGHPIVREADGLALSSRNVRLSRAQRSAAACVPLALTAARAEARSTGATAQTVVAAAEEVVNAEPLAELEYVTVFDPATLTEIDALRSEPGSRIATAVWFGDVRLIDNCDLFEP